MFGKMNIQTGSKVETNGLNVSLFVWENEYSNGLKGSNNQTNGLNVVFSK
jgi:hypothetical protein